MASKNRQDLCNRFRCNDIPTEQDFKDLIDSQLNQQEDGLFRTSASEPLGLVAGTDSQKRCLALYWEKKTGAVPDWLISLQPGQDPSNPQTNRRGFGVANGSGVTMLYLDATGKLGLGTNEPQAALHVARGDVRIENGLTVAGNFKTNGTAKIEKDFTVVGNLTTNGITKIDKELTVGGSFTTNGAAKIDKDLTVSGNFTTSGTAQIDRGLSVTGDLTASGTAAISKDLSLGGNLKSTGSAVIDKDLSVGGKLKTGSAEIDSGLKVGGKITLEGSLAASGAVTLGGSFAASGPVTLGKEDGSTDVVTKGALVAARSDLYFTKTDHNHSGIGNTMGYAAIENAASHNALMILGRQTGNTDNKRVVKLWDYLEIHGNFKATGTAEITQDLSVEGNIKTLGTAEIIGSVKAALLSTSGNADVGGSVMVGSTTSLSPSEKGRGQVYIGDWLLRASGTTLELVHISRISRPSTGELEPGLRPGAVTPRPMVVNPGMLTPGPVGPLPGSGTAGFTTQIKEKVVAIFDATQTGAKCLSFPG